MSLFPIDLHGRFFVFLISCVHYQVYSLHTRNALKVDRAIVFFDDRFLFIRLCALSPSLWHRWQWWKYGHGSRWLRRSNTLRLL